MAAFPLLICFTAGLIREQPRAARPSTPDVSAAPRRPAPEAAAENGEGAALLAGKAARAPKAAARSTGPHLAVQLRALGAALATPSIYLPALFLFAWTVRRARRPAARSRAAASPTGVGALGVAA